MKLSPPHQLSSFTRYAFTLIVLLVMTLISRSQTECPTQSTDTRGWLRDSTVRFNVGSLPPVLQTQAINALNTWNTANTRNNSGVTFVAADSNHPAVLNFSVGVPASGVPAAMFPTNSCLRVFAVKKKVERHELNHSLSSG